ncbi:DUF6968 family protein [Undibacterium sp. Di24W]|uniref:DUF6968 family protein n=1 Tax=Undibacterium sp. Di24W TaxID=3413033 RepID=UPI003BF12FA7
MIKLTKSRSRRLRKKLHVGEFQDLVYPIEEAIADRTIEFTRADGQVDSTEIFLWYPIQFGPHHWRCPFLIRSRFFEKSTYTAGCDSMQALILALHSIPSHLTALARRHDGVFSYFESDDLGFPNFCEHSNKL